MIDISNETLLTLTEAAQVRPRGRRGQPTHVSTVHRWIANGVRGVHLEAIRLGGQLYTSKEAIQRFAERLTHQAPKVVLTSPSTTRLRTRALKEAEKLLDRIGI